MKHLKYLFISIIGVIITISGVQAEETTCNELLPNYPEGYEWRMDGSLFLFNCSTTTCNQIFSLTSGKSYTLFYNNADVDMSLYDYKPTYISGYTLDTSNSNYWIITPRWSLNNITLFSPSSTPPPDDLIIHLVEGTEPCGIATEPEEPETPVDPEEPTEPEYPDISETDQGKILSNFYSIYLDRLGFVSEYFANNTLFLAFIAVIILFIILELFLKLYRGGGYR